jgi:3-oxoacyl-[acyl-carrier protein] reductase
MRLAGRVALITGASRGIGAGIAKRLAADGAKVVLHGRTKSDKLAAQVDAIRAAGGAASLVVGDLVTEEDPVRIVQEAFALHGALDVLVNNAGGGGGGMAVDHDIAKINRTLWFNLRAPILSTIEFAKLTKSPHGRVIMITSGAATHPALGGTVYSAAKAGMEAFARSVAQELGPRGITLNSVAPGMTQSDMVLDPRWPEYVGSWAALRRIGKPEDIADIVAFLASDEARWLTGVTLAANGGLITSASNLIARVPKAGS